MPFFNLRAVFVALLALCTTPAFAQNATFLRIIDVTGGVDVTYNATLAVGDRLQFFFQDGGGVGNVPGLDNLTVTISGATQCQDGGCDGDSRTISTNGPVAIRVQGQARAGQSFRFYVQCNSTGPSGCVVDSTTGGSTGGSGNGGGTTSTPSTTSASQAAAASGSASASAAGQAITSAMASKQGGAPVRVTRNAMFFAAPSNDTGRNMWGSIAYQSFRGDIDGQGADLTFGLDLISTDTMTLGLALSYGDHEIEAGGLSYDTTSLAVGPYISTSLSDTLTADAYILYGRPDYEVGGVSYSTDRLMAGADISLRYALGGTDGTGYIRVSGFTEDVPSDAPGGAQDISQVKASFGSRFDFARQGGLAPYAVLGVDFIRFDDGTSKISSTSPHVGFGFSQNMGIGAISLDIMGQELFEDARSVRLAIGYQAEF